MKIIIKL